MEIRALEIPNRQKFFRTVVTTDLPGGLHSEVMRKFTENLTVIFENNKVIWESNTVVPAMTYPQKFWCGEGDLNPHEIAR